MDIDNENDADLDYETLRVMRERYVAAQQARRAEAALSAPVHAPHAALAPETDALANGPPEDASAAADDVVDVDATSADGGHGSWETQPGRKRQARWFAVWLPDDCFYRLAAYLVVHELFAASAASYAFAASLTPAVVSPPPSLLPLPEAPPPKLSSDGRRPPSRQGATEVDAGARVAVGDRQLAFLCRAFPGAATLRLPQCSGLSVGGVAAALRALPTLTDLEVASRHTHSKGACRLLGHTLVQESANESMFMPSPVKKCGFAYTDPSLAVYSAPPPRPGRSRGGPG
jgi:hypothetical protein